MMFLGTQRINSENHLEIGGCDCVELAERFGTPLYVMDEAEMRAKCREYRQAFESRHPDVAVAFAGKAFLTLAMCRIAEQEGLWLDVASGGELHTALKARFPPERIYFHGNYKSEVEMATALAAGVGRIVVDSRTELDLLDRLASAKGISADILIRVTPGIKPDTHTYVQTGQIDSKFGLGMETGEAMVAVRQASSLSGIRLRGIHCHIGSSIYAVDPFGVAAQMMMGFAADVRRETGTVIEEVNMGGGLGVRYHPADEPPSIDSYGEAVVHAVRGEAERLDLPFPRISIEPGRGIVGEAGTTLYRVGVVKVIPGIRTYVSVDGGLADNPRPALYQAYHNVIAANKVNSSSTVCVTIAGKHCETDTLVHDVDLAPLQAGDILAVQTTGAYCYSMASNYNRFGRPAVVLVGDGNVDLIVERESLDDLIRQDRMPARLKS